MKVKLKNGLTECCNAKPERGFTAEAYCDFLSCSECGKQVEGELYKTKPHLCTKGTVQTLYHKKDKEAVENKMSVCPYCFQEILIQFESL